MIWEAQYSLVVASRLSFTASIIGCLTDSVCSSASYAEARVFIALFRASFGVKPSSFSMGSLIAGLDAAMMGATGRVRQRMRSARPGGVA